MGPEQDASRQSVRRRQWKEDGQRSRRESRLLKRLRKSFKLLIKCRTARTNVIKQTVSTWQRVKHSTLESVLEMVLYDSNVHPCLKATALDSFGCVGRVGHYLDAFNLHVTTWFWFYRS